MQDSRGRTANAADRRSLSAPTLLWAGAAGAVLLVLPLILSPFHLILATQAVVFAIACLGFNLLLGTTGLLSLGHAAYFGAGAYVGAMLVFYQGVASFEVYLASAVLSSTVFAAVIGLLCVGSGRIRFTLLTIVFAYFVYLIFKRASWLIPRLTMLGNEISPDALIPVLHVVAVVLLFVSAFLLWRITRSPFGRALSAIRDNETRAGFVGIPVRRYRWYAFILSGAFTGLAGGLFGQLNRQITPGYLEWPFSAEIVLATVLGGPRHFLGPVLGAFAVVGLDEAMSNWAVGRWTVMGLLLIVVVFAFPQGIAGLLAALWARTRGGAGDPPWR